MHVVTAILQFKQSDDEHGHKQTQMMQGTLLGAIG
jgi:hypothetical protein